MGGTTRALPALTTHAKQRILNHLSNSNSAPTICKLLKEEEIFINWVTNFFVITQAQDPYMSRKKVTKHPWF